MEPRKNWTERLIDNADLSTEPMPGVTVVELAEDRRVLLERHGGITEYSSNRICVKVRYGSVCICGDGLELTYMTKDQLVITGRIDCIQLQRRKR